MRRDDDAARLGRHRVGLDALVLERRAHQGDVEVAVEEGLREAGALLHDEPHVRLAGHLGREDRPVQLGEAVALDPHPELLHLGPWRGGGGVHGVQAVEHLSGVGHELGAGVGQLDPP